MKDYMSYKCKRNPRTKGRLHTGCGRKINTGTIDCVVMNVNKEVSQRYANRGKATTESQTAKFYQFKSTCHRNAKGNFDRKLSVSKTKAQSLL